MLARSQKPERAARLRIVVLQVSEGAWCVRCDAPRAVEATYVLEEPLGATPTTVHRLIYCPACEDE